MLKTNLEFIDLTYLDLPLFPEDSIVISCQVSEFVRSVRHFGPNLPVEIVSSVEVAIPTQVVCKLSEFGDFSDLVGFGDNGRYR